MKDIGTRMKENYEHRNRTYLTRRVPVIIRVDGRAFHTYTKSFDRPFDRHIQNAMVYAAEMLIDEIQGARLAYVQSDEISVLVTDWRNLQSQAWFDYNVQKLTSITASIATAAFNQSIESRQHPVQGMFYRNPTKPAMFDSRCFNIPLEEVANYFLWRVKDWYRNSITMYAQSVFSHKQLHGKSCSDMHEMLYQVGKNWATDLTEREKNGTFIYKALGGLCQTSGVTSCYTDVNTAVTESLTFHEDEGDEGDSTTDRAEASC